MERNLLNVGFEVVRSTSFASLLFPRMAASRLLSSSLKRDKDEVTKAEFHLLAFLNLLLGAVTDVQVTLKLAGLSWLQAAAESFWPGARSDPRVCEHRPPCLAWIAA
mgnify:CR=1 FL=1